MKPGGKGVYMGERLSWDDYFLKIMFTVAERSTCRGQAGAVIVKDKRLLTTGYAGSLPGLPHCDEVGHQLKKVTHENGSVTEHCMRTIHAEENAILQAAKNGISIDGATLYCKMEPCLNCCKSIIGAGIVRVVCAMQYQAAEDSRKYFKEAGVQLEVRSESLPDY